MVRLRSADGGGDARRPSSANDAPIVRTMTPMTTAIPTKTRVLVRCATAYASKP